MDEKIARELVKTRKAVRQKYNALKSDITEQQIRMEKEFKPITEPLQALIKTIKAEPYVKKESYSPQPFSTPKKTFRTPQTAFEFSTPKTKRRRTNIYERYLPQEMPSFLDDEEVFLEHGEMPSRIESSESTIEPSALELQDQVLEMTKTAAYQDFLNVYHPTVRSFVDELIKDTEDKFDHKYGLVYDIDNNSFKIANSLVTFTGENLKVENITYKGTVGLYELLFKKQPVGYTSKDLEEYMDILKRTNAYKRNFDENEQVQGSREPKYLKIIKPFLLKKGILKTDSTSEESRIPSTSGVVKPPQRPRSTRTRSGKGAMLNLSKNKIDFVYFDDINELVDRLKLLISSQMAGHTGHQNEIISILEELREAKIIE